MLLNLKYFVLNKLYNITIYFNNHHQSMYLKSENNMKSPGFLDKNVIKSYFGILKIIDFLVALIEVDAGVSSNIDFTSPMKAPESNSSSS